MKKVLFLIHTLGGGGAEKVLVNLVNNMDSEKYDITVMTVINTGINRYNLNDNIKYKYIFNVPFINKKKASSSSSGSLLGNGNFVVKTCAAIYTFLWKYMPTKLLYKFCIKEKYDVEIAFLEGITCKLVSASINPNSKKIGWMHVDVINEKKSEKFFSSRKQEKECYSRFDKIVCVSNVVKEKFIEKFDFDASKVVTKYNPIEADKIIELSNKETIEKPNEKLLVTIGRLISQKGYDRLLNIAKKLSDDGFKFKIWILGDGIEKDNFTKFIENNNLTEYVTLLGFQNNPYIYLKQADLFVCSSRAEGFSTVASEATVLGIPIITTNCSGMTELLGENNEYGIVTENNEEELYEGLKKILSDEELYRHYKNKIQERKSLFDIKKIVCEIEDEIDS